MDSGSTRASGGGTGGATSGPSRPTWVAQQLRRLLGFINRREPFVTASQWANTQPGLFLGDYRF